MCNYAKQHFYSYKDIDIKNALLCDYLYLYAISKIEFNK